MARIVFGMDRSVETKVRNTIGVLHDIRQKLPVEYFKLVNTAADLIGELGDHYCPKDTLELVRSKSVHILKGQSIASFSMMSDIEIIIQYGGASAPYAVYVHENPPDRQQHKPPTCYKWLERASREAMPDISSMIAADLDSFIHSSGPKFIGGGFNFGAR